MRNNERMVKENDTRKVVRRERVFSNCNIKQRFGSIARARQIAERNNMELDDLIQVGRMHLWACCVKCDAERIDTFHAYVMKGMKWAMSDESMKGMPLR